MKMIKRALISVSNKDNIVDFAKKLIKFDIEIISTGGTAKLLEHNNIKHIEISDYTKFPEIMDGRLKTIHPKIHGGLLGRRDIDKEIMAKHDILDIDLVVVNLYPFADAVAKEDCTLKNAIENIDIGGPTMLRSAGKNHHDVAVICSPDLYADFLVELEENSGKISQATRFKLAVKTFEHTAKYDGMIANYLGLITAKDDEMQLDKAFSDTINIQYTKQEIMRYGENPHQSACLYVDKNYNGSSVALAQQLMGKALSYNNIADTDTALECVLSFATPACVIVKHANPCGVATADNLTVAYEKAFSCDSMSAFGGIIAFNRTLDEKTAKIIIKNQFVEVIIAPDVDSDALNIIAKKKNVRVLKFIPQGIQKHEHTFKKVAGGLLVQDEDIMNVDKSDLKIVTTRIPTDKEIENALFAWKVVKYVKSNAIVYAKNNMSFGIGAGQMSRVFSSKIAIAKANEAGLDLHDSAIASDAFFPFRDGIDAAAEAGVSCIIQPGDSIKDQEIIDAANEHGIAMIFTGIRHFKH